MSWQRSGPACPRRRHATAIVSRLISLQLRPITHINFVTLKVPQSEELVKLDKIEPKGRGDLDLAFALELGYGRLGMFDDLVACPPHAEESSKNWIRRLAEAFGAHRNDILVVGSIILDKVTRQHLLFACVQC